MTVMLGKKKRKRTGRNGDEALEREDWRASASAEASGEETDERDIQDVFRRHFEAKFKPLSHVEAPVRQEKKVDVTEEEDREEEWEGFESGDEVAITVVEHNGTSQHMAARLEKHELRAFMSSKPPSTSTSTKSKSASTDPESSEDEDSAENLKNDLALKRLLEESHLLDRANSNGVDLDPIGKNRHKALDLRFQSLGSSSSIYKQEKMPLSFRKGIAEKAQRREEARRKEAKEAGIVLERKQAVKKHRERRERAVGGPAVGKFRGGMLVLSRKDVASIEGPRQKVHGEKGRRR